MKLLAIGRPRAGVDARGEIVRLAGAELHALWKLYRKGFVREMYSPAGPGAVLVIEAATAAAATATLAELPLVADQIIEFEVLELRPFTAIEMLFADQEQSNA